jgi:class 3 adenylate cyclase
MNALFLRRLGLFLFGFLLLSVPSWVVCTAVLESEKTEQTALAVEAREKNASLLSYFRNQESIQTVIDKHLTAAVFTMASRCRFDGNLHTTGPALASAAVEMRKNLAEMHIPIEHMVVCRLNGSGSQNDSYDFPYGDVSDNPLLDGLLRLLATQFTQQTFSFIPFVMADDLNRKLLRNLGSFNSFAFAHDEFKARSFPVKFGRESRLLFWANLMHPDHVERIQEDLKREKAPLRDLAMFPKPALKKYLIGSVILLLPRHLPPKRQIEILLNSYHERDSRLALFSHDRQALHLSPGFPATSREEIDRLSLASAAWAIASESVEIGAPYTLYAATAVKPVSQAATQRRQLMTLSLGTLAGGGSLVLLVSIFFGAGLTTSISRQLWTGFTLSALMPLAVSFFAAQHLVDERLQFGLQQNRLKLLQEMESIENRYHFHRPWLWQAMERISRRPAFLRIVRHAQQLVSKGNPIPEALKSAMARMIDELQDRPYQLSLRRLVISGVDGFFHSSSPPGREDSTDLFRVLISVVADNSLKAANPSLFAGKEGPPSRGPQFTQEDMLKEYAARYLLSIFGPQAFLNLLHNLNHPFSMGAGHGQWFVNSFQLPAGSSPEFFLSWMYLAKQSDRVALARILAKPQGRFRIFSFEADRIGNYAIPQAGENWPVLRTVARQILAARNRISLRVEIDGEPCQVEGSPLSKSEQFVLVGFSPEKPIRQEAARLRLVLSVSLLIMLLMVFLLSGIASWDILSPINRLKDGMSEIETGHFSWRLGSDRADELGEVSRAFDEMARHLEEAEVMKKLVSASARKALDSEDEEARARIGEVIDVTIVFIGIPGFSTLLAERSVERITDELDRHTAQICRMIDQHGGEIDKLIGDKVLSFFSHQDLGEDQAVTAALNLIGTLIAAQEAQELPFEVAIGVNSGTVIKGLLGSGDIRDFTIIGDPVNLAARAESVAETLPRDRTVITANTLQSYRRPITIKPLNITKVKGKQKEVMLSQILGTGRSS